MRTHAHAYAYEYMDMHSMGVRCWSVTLTCAQVRVAALRAVRQQQGGDEAALDECLWLAAGTTPRFLLARARISLWAPHSHTRGGERGGQPRGNLHLKLVPDLTNS
jgi:hypothetical protein